MKFVRYTSMKQALRSALIILLAAASIFCSVGCGENSELTAAHSTSTDLSPEPDSGALSDTPTAPETTPETEPETAPETEPETEPETTPAEPQTADSLTEVRDILCSAKERDEMRVCFTYNGAEELSARTVARMTAAFYITVSYIGREYTVEMTEYPGDRMYDAYRSGDRSGLSEEESRLLDAAVLAVEDIMRGCTDRYGIELAIFQYIASHVTYCNPTADISDINDPPRHLSVLGALGDGTANCQGYADAFYLLASIAGFEVSRMNVTDADGVGHILNTVRLDGAWYVVDATYGDTEPTSYRLFNAGRDVCGEYFWDEEMEYRPIADESDAHFYFYREDGRAFSSLEALCKRIKDGLADGESTFSLMLKGKTASYTDLTAALNSALADTGKSRSYSVGYVNSASHTYYTVVFAQE